MTTERALVREATRRLSVKESADSDFEAKLERAEKTYEDLVRTRASLGTALAETIRRGRDLSEFRRRMEDLPLLIRKADAKKSHAEAASVERRSVLEARRLKELRDEEAVRLEQLRAEERKPHEVAV